jgi:hypothetical protein
MMNVMILCWQTKRSQPQVGRTRTLRYQAVEHAHGHKEGDAEEGKEDAVSNNDKIRCQEFLLIRT